MGKAPMKKFGGGKKGGKGRGKRDRDRDLNVLNEGVAANAPSKKNHNPKDNFNFAGSRTVPLTERARFHVRCKRFSGRTSEEVGAFLEKAFRELFRPSGPSSETTQDMTAKAKPPVLVDFFKLRAWDFGFLTVAKTDCEAATTFLTREDFDRVLLREFTLGVTVEEECQHGSSAASDKKEGEENKDKETPGPGAAASFEDGKTTEASATSAPAAREPLVTVKEAIERPPRRDGKEKQFSAAPDAAEQGGDRFGYKAGHVPTLMELKVKLANWSRQRDIPLVDKVTPLFSQWDYAQQMKMKLTYTRTTCKNIVKRMNTFCKDEGLQLPQWSNIHCSNHGVIVEPIIACPKYVRDIGYRNKVEFSCGQKDQPDEEVEGTAAAKADDVENFEVGFVQRMDYTNEQIVGCPQNLPHVSACAKQVAMAMKRVIRRSGLPVYKRSRGERAGFWRLVMCRTVDTKDVGPAQESSTSSVGATSTSSTGVVAAGQQDLFFRGRAMPKEVVSKTSDESGPAVVSSFTFTDEKHLCAQDEEDAKRLLSEEHQAHGTLPPEEHKILLVIQVTCCHDPQLLAGLTNLVREEFKDLRLCSVYWALNDGMSDAFDFNAPLFKLLDKNDEQKDEAAKKLLFDQAYCLEENEKERNCSVRPGLEGNDEKTFVKRFQEVRSHLLETQTEDAAVSEISAVLKRERTHTDAQNSVEFVRGLRGNKWFGPGTLLSSTSVDESPAGSEDDQDEENASDGEEEECSPTAVSSTAGGTFDADQMVVDTEERTATGNLMRRRTKNEKKKRKNVNVNPEQTMYHAFGDEALEMPLCGLNFTVGPSSFFQTNSAVTEKLYNKALEWAGVGVYGSSKTETVTTTSNQESQSGENDAITSSTTSPASEQATAPVVSVAGVDLKQDELKNKETMKKPNLILDICSGVGTIGCIAAKRDPASLVIGVELIPEAVAAANANASANKLDNCVFLCGKAEEVLPGLFSYLHERAKNTKESKDKLVNEPRFARIHEQVDTVLNRVQTRFAKSSGEADASSVEFTGFGSTTAIVDPPRIGLHKDVSIALARNLGIERLVYVSCNPDTLCDDVIRLCAPQGDDRVSGRFVPFKAVPVDMFPHTVHLEMVLYLERYCPARHDHLWTGEPEWVLKMRARQETDRRPQEVKDSEEAEKTAKRRKVDSSSSKPEEGKSEEQY
ncbi:unnamed protein product [Amoebophrya sp. A25]|nr:unnamed protein product [Amoebophrya sp. A25]|eukprot:GSA25T00014177001.1